MSTILQHSPPSLLHHFLFQQLTLWTLGPGPRPQEFVQGLHHYFSYNRILREMESLARWCISAHDQWIWIPCTFSDISGSLLRVFLLHGKLTMISFHLGKFIPILQAPEALLDFHHGVLIGVQPSARLWHLPSYPPPWKFIKLLLHLIYLHICDIQGIALGCI